MTYSIHDYVEIKKNRTPFDEDDLIRMAHRSNNKKRDYLFVNRLLGKHTESDAQQVFDMQERLVDTIATELKEFIDKRILVVGFAETATGLGQGVVYHSLRRDDLNIVEYVQTTRETVNESLTNGLVKVDFSEEHSHATQQLLYLNPNTNPDLVLFVEDEITTGNTIKNAINKIADVYPRTKYAVASFLNWNDSKIHEDCIAEIALIDGRLKSDLPKFDIETVNLPDVETVDYRSEIRTVSPRTPMSINAFVGYTELEFPLSKSSRTLVIGVEEDMFIPALYARMQMYDVKTTTRSPIAASRDEDYPINSCVRFVSPYDNNRITHLYNVDFENYDHYTIVLEDGINPMSESVFKNQITEILSKHGDVDFVYHNQIRSTRRGRVKSSYSEDDVTILLQDVKGKVPVLDTEERELRIQTGTHYSEMLPVEYVPSAKYMELFYKSMDQFAFKTAEATATLAEMIHERKGRDITLVSLARAGTPIGILLKRYLNKTHPDANVTHYSISIIRGKGIDKAAMREILRNHDPESVVFVDGWVGKGAINRVLAQAVSELGIDGLDPELAVLSDPANETALCGTRDDFLIPSSCLNSTISGLVSRTVHTPNMTDDEFHGAVYYEENESADLSNYYIDEIEKHFDNVSTDLRPDSTSSNRGIDEVERIASEFGIDDVNKVKPGVGETTRVLLRRVPDRILIRKDADPELIEPIIQLAKEKGVVVQEYQLQNYNACGIIKDVTDA